MNIFKEKLNTLNKCLENSVKCKVKFSVPEYYPNEEKEFDQFVNGIKYPGNINIKTVEIKEIIPIEDIMVSNMFESDCLDWISNEEFESIETIGVSNRDECDCLDWFEEERVEYHTKYIIKFDRDLA